MLKGKEIITIIIALLALAFSNAFINGDLFVKSLFIFAIILIVHITAKKLTAYFYEAEEEIKIWTFQRYGFYRRSYLRTPVPIGIILAFFLSLISSGNIPWFAVTESEIKPTVARAARRHDYYSFLEMSEWNLALVSAFGIGSIIVLSIFAYLLNFPDLARAAIYFACFNMLPLGKLDGTRLFFGSRMLYAILAVLCLIGLGYALLLV